MKKTNLRLIIFFTVLTFVMTAVVIVAWEQVLRPPFYAWVDRNYPGPENTDRRWKIQQRVEHVFISMTVDVVVVSILIALVSLEHRQAVVALERLAHSEKIAALGQVAAQVAHEVKNPLAGLLLYSMHLRTKVGDKLPESEQELIEKIIQTVNHLTLTVDQVMNYARPVQLVPHPHDLNQIIRDTLQLAAPQLTATRVEIELALAEPSAVATVDESSMRAVLMNLVINAVQAMSGGGRLRVESRVQPSSVIVRITDSGPGMDRQQMERIFEPFYTTKSQGLGLGMAYAKKIVEQHGGIIRVDSRRGEGTTIEIDVPTQLAGGNRG